MGYVYADIELINSHDVAMVKRHKMDQDEVRRIHLNTLVDTGSYMMAINENIQSILNLSFIERKFVYLANDKGEVYDVVGPVEVRFADRVAVCSAYVLPGDSRPLLGAIPMEQMGLIIDAQRQELHVLEEPYLRTGVVKPFKG